MTETGEKITAEQLYQQLQAATRSKQKKRSLELLWRVLNEQRERGSQNFSIAMIGRLTGALGGPKEQTIRNEAGAEYRHLIRMFADESSSSKMATARGRKGSLEDEILAGIRDIALRARVGIILAEKRKLMSELNMLRSAIQREYIIPEIKVKRQNTAAATAPPALFTGAESAVSGRVDILPPDRRFLPQEIRAVEHFLSAEHLATHGWIVTQDGALKREAGKGPMIAKPGFAPALRKLLAGPG
jgi:hypothetical protein